MSKFTYIELFAGIGGFRQALDSMGGECVFASEIDKFAKQAYTTLYGGNHLHGDITKISETDIPDHDLIVAGIPCQAFSVAGKRMGFEDTRGTLFFDVARIAKEKRPKAVWIENVKGLVGHDKGRTLDTIVKTLNDIGYTVDFEVLNSKYFGVPQNRERIFIVAVRDDLVSQEPWIIEGTTVVPKGKRRISAYEGVKTFNFDSPEQTEVTTRLRDIIEKEVDEKYYLSEDKTAKLVAQLEEVDTNTQTGEEYSRKTGVGKARDISICLSSSDWRGLNRNQTQTAVAEVHSVGNVNPSGRGMNGTVYDIEAGLSPTLTTNKGEGTKLLEEVRPVLTPDRMEKRQNGRRFKHDDEPAFTLNTQDRHGVAIGKQPRYRIRKLTPLECWRLQGFSDEAHQALVNAGISDSQRYKMAGNAVSVPVISAIGKRLLPFIASAEK